MSEQPEIAATGSDEHRSSDASLEVATEGPIDLAAEMIDMIGETRARNARRRPREPFLGL